MLQDATRMFSASVMQLFVCPIISLVSCLMCLNLRLRDIYSFLSVFRILQNVVWLWFIVEVLAYNCHFLNCLLEWPCIMCLLLLCMHYTTSAQPWTLLLGWQIRSSVSFKFYKHVVWLWFMVEVLAYNWQYLNCLLENGHVSCVCYSYCYACIHNPCSLGWQIRSWKTAG
jgi:hypothetical protein